MKSLLLLGLLVTAAADRWAVIVAGSSGYDNYRHQADACHAYQIFKKKGISESNIITLAYDDVAHDIANPFKGKLFNKPDPNGPGIDVYEGCKIDYSHHQVTPTTFVNVLTGKGSGKVLNSTADDEVFVTFFDHGAVGLIAFPDIYIGPIPLPGQTMHKKQLQDALKTMHDQKMYKKLTFYLESCESGSMFEDMSIPGIYAVSAANPSESSWGTYCGGTGGSNKVNGKTLGTCLGDLFSVNWMEDDDAKDTTKETLEAQFETVKKLTNKSHVMQWSDLTFKSDYVSEFIGSKAHILAEEHAAINAMRLSSAVSAREVDMYRWYNLYNDAETGHERVQYGKGLQEQLNQQQAAESAYRHLAELAYPNDEDKQKAARRLKNKPNHPTCEMEAHYAFEKYCSDKFKVNSGFALQFHQVVVNICADIASGMNLMLPAAVQAACGSQPFTV